MARLDRGRLLLGLILVVLGVLLILERTGLVGGFNVWSLWPLVVIAVGLSMLTDSRGAQLGGWIVTGVGVVLLVQSLDLFSFDVWGIFGALLLVGLGLWIILRRDLPVFAGVRRPSAGGEPSLDDTVSLTTVFGDRHVASTTTAFQGGVMTVVFGDLDLDLSRAQLAPTGATLDVVSVFGDADIIVPPGWEVQVNRTEILGDVKDRTTPPIAPTPTAPPRPRLTIRATAILGDVDVRQYG